MKIDLKVKLVDHIFGYHDHSCRYIVWESETSSIANASQWNT